jgi:serine/threonine-protein kinase HipA
MADLPVYFEQRAVGAIKVDGKGPAFAYDRTWLATRGAFPISTTMPLRAEPFDPAVFLPWAANLLPESGQLRAVGQFLGMSPSDVVGLLSEIGRDTAGALSIGKPGGTSSVYWRPVATEEELARVIEELPTKPFLVGEEGVSMSLAGVQAKLAVGVDDDGRICIPTVGSPSTHILKPDSQRLPGGVHNEAFCLTLAGKLGLKTVDVTTGKAGERTFLLAKRYDRSGGEGRFRRLHQEDFCQALGKPPLAKYETNQTGVAGPTLKDMFDLARRSMPATEILRLLDMAIFNVIACNTDAHAKNYSIMLTGAGASLAPIYDVMCGAPWRHVTKNFAQKIAGKARGEQLTAEDWHRFAKECGLGARQVVARVRDLAQAAKAAAGAAAADVAAMPAGGHPILGEVQGAIEQRAQTLLAQLDAPEAEASAGEAMVVASLSTCRLATTPFGKAQAPIPFSSSRSADNGRR